MAELPYYAPAASNGLLDAEATGREAVAPDGQTRAVLRTIVAAPELAALLDELGREATLGLVADRALVAADRLAELRAGQASPFARLLKYEPAAGHELRSDDLAGGDRFHGTAPDGTATSAPEWAVVRFYRDPAGAILRVRYRAGVAWNDRASGWS